MTRILYQLTAYIEIPFSDTAIFNFSDEATSIWMLPALVLRRMVLTGLHIGGGSDPGMEDATEVIYEGLKTFEQADLASRLTLSSLPAVVASNNIHDLPVTIIDVFDDCSLTQVSILFKQFPINCILKRLSTQLIPRTSETVLTKVIPPQNWRI